MASIAAPYHEGYAYRETESPEIAAAAPNEGRATAYFTTSTGPLNPVNFLALSFQLSVVSLAPSPRS